ncbi:Hydroperoxy fatty acid reductase gpx1 [Commensalibacter sp. Nvir]|uniref:glutathione peroxidase n=1 Tax=Commensalibacter sp. Nvir TaxID=3069817 RepID=UPI002D3FF6CF|nr:Hydroperoxy fatty acid reductase gpx1 [Commensalibacter sp. Nvir]
MNTIYDFKLTLQTGKPLHLKHYQDKPILIVNTASKCKFTPQYEELQDIWSIYRHYGVAVIGVPSGDFGKQEFETNEEIQKFCREYYNVGFFLCQKCHVKGENAIPLFQWLAKQGGILSIPRWNFYKYVINRQGHLFRWFTSITKPSSKKIKNAIERVYYDN